MSADSTISEIAGISTRVSVQSTVTGFILLSAGMDSIVSTIKDVFEDPQIAHRDYLPKLKHSVMGYHTYHKLGFILSKGKSTWRAGPALGEHNEYVFKELLGMTDDEIADALIKGGITTDADLPT